MRALDRILEQSRNESLRQEMTGQLDVLRGMLGSVRVMMNAQNQFAVGGEGMRGASTATFATGRDALLVAIARFPRDALPDVLERLARHDLRSFQVAETMPAENEIEKLIKQVQKQLQSIAEPLPSDGPAS